MSEKEKEIRILDRRWVKPSQISKHLNCSICEEVFINPRRLKCSHTFCELCIQTWFKTQRNCPQCRAGFKLKDLGKDLIAEKIINDLEVFCINDKYCKWKDKLELLPRHVEVCEFQDKNLQDWLQSFDKKTQNDETMVENKNLLLYYQNEHLLEKINNEIPKAPLLARLYTKDNSSKTLLTESLVPVNFESKEIFDTKDSFDILEGFFNNKDDEENDGKILNEKQNLEAFFELDKKTDKSNKEKDVLLIAKNDENLLPFDLKINSTSKDEIEQNHEKEENRKKRRIKEPALIYKLKQMKS